LKGVPCRSRTSDAQPEAYIGGADKLFDANGKLVNGTRKFLEDFLRAYAAGVAASGNS